MQFTCLRSNLLRAVRLADKCVPTSTRKPVLLNLRAELLPDKGGLLLSATDLECSIRTVVNEIETSDVDGACLLPAGRLTEILTKSSDEELVSVETQEEGKRARVSFGKAEFLLPLDDMTEFPDVPKFDAPTTYLEVSSSELRQAIASTKFACDVESQRYALNGALFEPNCKKLRVVATDGRRLAVARVSMTTTGDEAELKGSAVVVPIKALGLIEAALPDDAAERAKIVLQPNRVIVECDAKTTIATRIVEGRFPRYQEVFPSRSTHTVSLPNGDLALKLRQAAITTDETARGVDLDFTPDGKLELKSMADSVGKGDCTMQVAWSGEALSITIHPRYVTDLLATFPHDETLEWRFIDRHSVIHVRSAERDYDYLLMPLIRNR